MTITETKEYLRSKISTAIRHKNKIYLIGFGILIFDLLIGPMLPDIIKLYMWIPLWGILFLIIVVELIDLLKKTSKSDN